MQQSLEFTEKLAVMKAVDVTETEKVMQAVIVTETETETEEMVEAMATCDGMWRLRLSLRRSR